MQISSHKADHCWPSLHRDTKMRHSIKLTRCLTPLLVQLIHVLLYNM